MCHRFPLDGKVRARSAELISRDWNTDSSRLGGLHDCSRKVDLDHIKPLHIINTFGFLKCRYSALLK